MSDQLAAIDEALETGTADHGDPRTRELQELALALRADAPEGDPSFQQQLRGRVESGFPRERRARTSTWRKRLMAPAAATGLIVLPLVLIVVVAGGRDERFVAGSDGGGAGAEMLGGAGASEAGAPQTVEQASGGDDDAGGGQARSRRAADQAAAGSAPAVALPPGGGFAPGQRNRKIERSIGLELEMPVDEMTRVAEQVTTVTNRHGGFVLSSSVSTGQDSAGGDFELRIPATRLRPALRDLGALADVRTQSQTGRDVTREHVTARDRLRAARAERRSLLRRLELAVTDEEAEAIRRRLDLVAGEINGLRAQLRDLRLRTDYAVVTVSLLPSDGDQGGAGGGSFDDALGDAGDLLVAMAGVIVRALAVALPLALIALVGWLAGRAVRRRQRESALA
jgi:hypothetical protein